MKEVICLSNLSITYYQNISFSIVGKMLVKKPQPIASMNIPGPPTRFWECMGQNFVRSIGERQKSEFPGKHPWHSTISERVADDGSPGAPRLRRGSCILSMLDRNQQVKCLNRKDHLRYILKDLTASLKEQPYLMKR